MGRRGQSAEGGGGGKHTNQFTVHSFTRQDYVTSVLYSDQYSAADENKMVLLNNGCEFVPQIKGEFACKVVALVLREGALQTRRIQPPPPPQRPTEKENATHDTAKPISSLNKGRHLRPLQLCPLQGWLNSLNSSRSC
jgi:hypothetical protein